MTRTTRVRWAEAFRAINSRYPPVDVFEHVAERADWETLLRIEEMTNPRVREEWGEIARIPPDERPSGPGASWIVAAFTHVGWPSRFSDGSYGVYYAARALETAVWETAYHFGRFLAATAEPRGTEIELRVLVSKRVEQRFHDVRTGHPELHRPDDYRTSQAFAAPLRAAGSNGLVYNSVRHPGGSCLAVLRPKAIPCPQQGAHLRYHFDGSRIDRWFRIGEQRWRPLDAAG
ncbi:MAG TPA: RES family NAD+ phosphorylase [Polyangiaceae bacterium]|nr:RES family NAD+ phosphorylase [Polyangiaceae bacterium]